MRIYNFFVLLVEIDGIIQACHYFAYILGSVSCYFLLGDSKKLCV